MSLRKIITRQFEHPQGILGRVVGYILATRGSNLLRNRWIVDLLAPSGDERVLEIGCGLGVALELCLSAAPGVRAAGIDHSALMIAKAAERNRAAVQSGRLKLYEGSVDALPASAPAFDKAFSNNVIQFVDDQQGFLTIIAAHLRPGGVLATTYQPRHARATRADALKSDDDHLPVRSRIDLAARGRAACARDLMAWRTRAASLESQGRHRVNFRGPSRRDPARHQGDERQQ